jgi:hypothetical protein
MKLDAQERLSIIMLLTASEGSFDAMHTLRRVRGLVGFTYAEQEKLQAGEAIDAKEVFMDEWTLEYIGKQLLKASEAEKLPFEMLPIFDKFVFVDNSDKFERLSDEQKAKAARAREDMNTVALVGMSPRSCAMAPWEDKKVAIWGENESHAFSFFERADAWFQVHNSYRQKTAKRGVVGHYDWLKENKWNIPIYMQKVNKDIAKSEVYPLQDVCDVFLSKIYRGYKRIKYFNSSFDYMIAMALLKNYERIEIYGFDMAGDNEYGLQKPSAEFWLGIASQHADIIMPDNCLLLKSELYGGKEQGEGW